MSHSIYRRAMFMHLLLTGYKLFNSIQTKKRCTNSEFTYKDAEEIANALEEIAGMDVSPSQLLFNKNELADKLLDDYQKLQSMMNSTFDEITRSIANAYYHHLYFYRKPDFAGVIHPVLIALTAFMDYITGVINKEELKNNMVAFDIRNNEMIVIDSKYARHNFIKLEKDFNDICIKHTNRFLKKPGKDQNSNCSINISIS